LTTTSKGNVAAVKAGGKGEVCIEDKDDDDDDDDDEGDGNGNIPFDLSASTKRSVPDGQ
jgi:hypothetical protein